VRHIIYLRGLANMQTGSRTEAAADFQRVLENRGLAGLSLTYPLARLGLARAYAQMGDVTRSRKAYEDLFALWKDADPDLPLLLEARAEYAALELRAAN
jgi:eukaryotic-like serine/threonine-protein kinase